MPPASLRIVRAGFSIARSSVARCTVVFHDACGDSLHSIVSASRPRFAAQVLSATTAMPVGIWITATTPFTFFAAAPSNETTFAPSFGDRATTAYFIPLRRTSRP